MTCVLAIAACSARAPIGSCDDALRGVYAAGDERWMVLDHGDTLEAYPLFPDGDAAAPSARDAGDTTTARLEIAPRVIDLERGDAPASPDATGAAGSTSPPSSAARTITGTVRRRYLQRAAACEARVPVHVTRCAGDTIELVLADPAPPLGFAPCTWPAPAPSRVVRWRRQ
jgi:hypothetical protein